MTKKEHETILKYAIAEAFARGYENGYKEGYLDSEDDNAPDIPQMYTEYVVTSDNESIPRGYRYGQEWVGNQLFMEGGFDSEEEAYLYWYKEMTEDDPEH